jgi:hypothetical protein
MKCYLDLDGCFADLDSFTHKIDPLMSTYDSKKWWKTLEHIDNLFYKLEMLPRCMEIYYTLKENHHEIEFLTAIPHPYGKFASCAEDKTAWVHKHVDPLIKVNTVIGGSNKRVYAKQFPGALLIDDFKPNLDKWVASGGVAILHESVSSTLTKLKLMSII